MLMLKFGVPNEPKLKPRKRWWNWLRSPDEKLKLRLGPLLPCDGLLPCCGGGVVLVPAVPPVPFIPLLPWFWPVPWFWPPPWFIWVHCCDWACAGSAQYCASCWGENDGAAMAEGTAETPARTASSATLESLCMNALHWMMEAATRPAAPGSCLTVM